jgi:hypothetical protein
MVKGTDCIGSCKSNYHTITATTPPPKKTTKNNNKKTQPLKKTDQAVPLLIIVPVVAV